MKIRLIAGILASVMLFSACGSEKAPDKSSSTDSKIIIITTLSIFQEMAEEIAKSSGATVQSIIPSGIEPHDYEPTPQDILALKNADLFIYNGIHSLEPWIEKTLPFIPDTEKLDLSSKVSLQKNDPHYWLDVENNAKVINAILEVLSRKYPANINTYEKNAQALKSEWQALDVTYKTQLKNCEIRTIITAHDAYQYLATRYNIETHAIAGLSPESEPDAKTIAAIINLVKEKKIPYILFETLASPKIAQTIAQETGAQTLVLNPLEGMTKEEKAAGKSFITLMEENLIVLKKAMKCTI